MFFYLIPSLFIPDIEDGVPAKKTFDAQANLILAEKTLGTQIEIDENVEPSILKNPLRSYLSIKKCVGVFIRKKAVDNRNA